jgi:hypothetical protein
MGLKCTKWRCRIFKETTKNLRRGVEGLSPSWADVTSSSKKLSSNSSKSSSSSACYASITCSNFLRQRSMVGEAPARVKNDRVFKVQLHRRLGCLASKHPTAFWPPPNGPLVCVYRIKMAGNHWGCSKGSLHSWPRAGTDKSLDPKP